MQYLDAKGLETLWGKIKDTFQAQNTNLTNLLALNSTGLLKKGANNTWTLDTNVYLTGNQSITLSGDVSGSGSTSIAVTIGAGKVTNAMLAGSIANGKLVNSKVTIAGTDVSLGGSITAETLRTNLGLGSVYDKSSTTTVSTNTDTSVPTSKAVKAYVDAAVSGASNYLGTVTELSQLSTTAKKGDFYRVATAWTGVHIGDILIAEQDNPAAAVITTGTNGYTCLHNELNTDTTYTLSAGANNGQITLTPSTGTAQTVTVKGINTAAYKAESYFVAANTAITGATKCKITYDSKGLVTGGADLASTDIPSLDASKITTGTFADARIASAATWNAKQNAIDNVTDTASGYVSTVSQTSGKISVGHTAFVKPTVTWTAGTTSGPTLSVKTDGGSATAVAIPSASSSASGIVTTGTQSFAGIKTFANTTDSTDKSTGSLITLGGLGVAKNINAGGNISASGGVAARGISDLNVAGGGGSVSQIRAWSEYDSSSTDQVLGANLGVELYNGKADKVSITAGNAGTSSATSGSTLEVPYVTINSQGLVTGYGTHTHTINGLFTDLSSNTTNAVSLTVHGTTKNITAATLKTSLGLGSLAYKSSLVAGDIPNLAWSKITSGKPTTLSGYGITDAELDVTTNTESVITAFELTIGSNVVTVGAIPDSVINALA